MTESLTVKKPLAGNNVINQIAFVVRDIEQASEAFSKLLGIPRPNWFLTGDREVSKVSLSRSANLFTEQTSIYEHANCANRID